MSSQKTRTKENLSSPKENCYQKHKRARNLNAYFCFSMLFFSSITSNVLLNFVKKLQLQKSQFPSTDPSSMYIIVLSSSRSVLLLSMLAQLLRPSSPYITVYIAARVEEKGNTGLPALLGLLTSTTRQRWSAADSGLLYSYT